MSSGYKYATIEGTVQYSGGQVFLRRGMSADPEHPLVKERPELFDDAPAQPELSVNRAPETYIGRQAPAEVVEVDGAAPHQEEEPQTPPKPIERATRRPGEKRPTRAHSATPEPTTPAPKAQK